MKSLLTLGLLLSSITLGHAADCITSFDNSCLSHQPTPAEVEADAKQAQQHIDDMLQEQADNEAYEMRVEQAEIEAQRRANKEAREEERLNIEASKAAAAWSMGRAMGQIPAAINGSLICVRRNGSLSCY